jgi:23S rRNA pseudouridine1911/1915/1917 synthase
VEGVIEAPLGKDERSRVAIKDCVRTDGIPARTDFRVQRQFIFASRIEGPAGSAQPVSLLRVVPRTGRKHQIRIHLAHIGHPIVGDKLYGGDDDLYLALVENRLTSEQHQVLILPNHALHARVVRFKWRDREVAFEADAPAWRHWPVPPFSPANEPIASDG